MNEREGQQPIGSIASRAQYVLRILLTWSTFFFVFPIIIYYDVLFIILRTVNNNLSSSIPKELNYFRGLVTLDLYYNKLTGTIPDLSHLVSLEQLDLDGNNLSGTVPVSLFNLPSIGKLCSLFWFGFRYYFLNGDKLKKRMNATNADQSI